LVGPDDHDRASLTQVVGTPQNIQDLAKDSMKMMNIQSTPPVKDPASNELLTKSVQIQNPPKAKHITIKRKSMSNANTDIIPN
jgi:hypothetical protein